MIDIEKSSHNVMDVTVYALTMQEVLQWAKEGMGDEKPRLIATANAEMIMQAQEDKELGRILNRADLVVPDGAGVLWAGETLGTPFPERVTGADLSVELLKIASKEGWPVYFLGGAPGVAKKAADRFQKSHGEIRLVGCHDGYFDEEEEKRIIKDIRYFFKTKSVFFTVDFVLCFIPFKTTIIAYNSFPHKKYL